MSGRLAGWTALALATTVLAVAIWQMREAVALLGLAIAAGAGVRPAVQWGLERGYRRSVVLSIVFLGLLLVGGALVGWLGVWLAADIVLAADRAPVWYETLRTQLDALGWQLPNLPTLTRWALGDSVQAIGALALDAGTQVMNAAVTGLTIAALCFYWVLDQPRIERIAFSMVSLAQRGTARAIWDRMYEEIGVFVRSEALTLVLTTLGLLGLYAALGIPGATALALLGGATQIVPLLGPPLGLLPAVVVAATVSQITAVIALVRLLIVRQVLRTSVTTNPVLVVALILALEQLGGIGLIVLAAPLAAAIQTVARGLVAQRGRDLATTERPEVALLAEQLAAIETTAAAVPPQLNDMLGRARRLVAEAQVQHARS